MVSNDRFQNDREKLAVAVKTLTSEADVNDRVTFLREGAINGQFRHRNVVRLHGVVTIGSPVIYYLLYCYYTFYIILMKLVTNNRSCWFWNTCRMVI